MQRHHGNAGDHLGHRIDAEDRVLFHRELARDVALPPRPPVDDAPLACQKHDDAGVLPLIHEALHAGIEPRQALFVEADRSRSDRRERLANLARPLGADRRVEGEGEKNGGRQAEGPR